MESECAERTHDIFDFILLKQADASDSGRSRPPARSSVFDGDATESEDGNFRPASFPQGEEPGRLRSGSAAFSEYRSEDSKVGSLGLGAEDISDRVTRRGHQKVVGRPQLVGRNLQHMAHFTRRDIIGVQMDAIGVHGQRNVGAGVNEQASSEFSIVPQIPVLSLQRCVIAYGGKGVSRHRFQFSGAQISFAKLDVVEAGPRGFGNLGEQVAATG
jgi:hypothetical protein